jgi:phosphohistidine phosphatase
VRLYLVQHGQAKSESEDADRPLTDQGIGDVERVAHLAVERFDVRATRVVHSGKTRARQTAEVWGGLLQVPVEPADGLAPNDDPAIWVARLDGQDEGQDLVLVGHLPHLGRLSGLLLFGAPDKGVLQFRQGGVVGLERTDTGWVVFLLLPP